MRNISRLLQNNNNRMLVVYYCDDTAKELELDGGWGAWIRELDRPTDHKDGELFEDMAGSGFDTPQAAIDHVEALAAAYIIKIRTPTP